MMLGTDKALSCSVSLPLFYHSLLQAGVRFFFLLFFVLCGSISEGKVVCFPAQADLPAFPLLLRYVQ